MSAGRGPVAGRFRRRSPWDVLPLLALVAGCGEGGAGPSTVTMDTLPGGRVRATNLGPAWTPETAWRLEEDLRIGAVDGSEAEQFGEIASVMADAAGSIYVLESQAQEVRVFSPEGRFSHRVGRAGEGPGELQRATAMDIAPDGRLWVVDLRSGYSVFERDSTFVERHPRPVLGIVRPWPGGRWAAGSLRDWITDALAVEMQMRETGVFTGDVRYAYPVRLSPDFRTADTLPPLSFPVPAGGVTAPWGDGLAIHQDSAGGIWFARVREYAVYHRGATGDTSRVFTLPAMPVAVTAVERDSVVAARAALPPMLRIAAEDIPGTKPVIRHLFGDEAGHIYVVPEVAGTPAGSAVDVFREDGTYLGRLSLPQPMLLPLPGPFATRDHLYVVVTDALDVPYVTRLRIVRPD